MIRKFSIRCCVIAFSFVILLRGTCAWSQEQSQQGQEQQTEQQQKKKKKKGGFFSGLKAVTGESGEQTEATRTAGSKSVGEGEKMGNVTPTASDRQQVTALENYSIPADDVKKFQQQGHLEPQK